MKKKFMLLTASLGLAALTGCNTSYINQPSSQLEVKAVASVKPVISVGEKIEGMAAITRTLFVILTGPGKFAEGVNYGNNQYWDESVSGSVFGDTVEMAKAAAAYRACAENKADFIICPRYVISVTDYGLYKKVQAKVTGYKGVLQDVVLPEDKQNTNSIILQNSLKNFSDELKGIKNATDEIASNQKKEIEESKSEKNIQKDVLKKDTNPDTSLKLDSKLNING